MTPRLENERSFEDVACTVCACVCDDLTLTVNHNRIIRAEHAGRTSGHAAWTAGLGRTGRPRSRHNS